MEIRRIRAGEGALLRQLRLRALADAPQAFTTQLADAARQPPASWEARAAAGAAQARTTLLVAVAGGRWRAMVAAAPHRADPAALLVHSLWVAPEVRRAGVATALMSALEAWAREAGAARLALDVYQHNAAARRLYAQLGFVVTGLSPGALVCLAREL